MCEVTLGGEGGSTRGMFLSFYCQMSNQIVAIRDTVKPTVHMYKMDRPELSPLEPHPNISISVHNYPADAEVAAGQCQWNHLHSPLHPPLSAAGHTTQYRGHNWAEFAFFDWIKPQGLNLFST